MIDVKIANGKAPGHPALRAPSVAENSVNYDMGRLIESAEVVLERTDSWQ